MGKTYKRFTGIFRSPKGHRNAVRNGCRKRKTPPDDWEDIPADDQCYVPFKVAWALHMKGHDRAYIAKRLKHRFKLKNWQIKQIIPQGPWRRRGKYCYCDECLRGASGWDRWAMNSGIWKPQERWCNGSTPH